MTTSRVSFRSVLVARSRGERGNLSPVRVCEALCILIYQRADRCRTMSLVVEAVYENGIFRPVGEVSYPDRQRVRLDIEVLPSGPMRRRGSAESLAQAFAEMDRCGRVDESEWARLEGERKVADFADLEGTLLEAAGA
jgi:predicted DNA-binding antitoxin AbrB/MazE fold protein